jgi:ABC-type transport system substrate-binding protein
MIVVGVLAFGGFSGTMEPARSEGEIVLKAAVQDEMKTTNILNSNDVWTSHVLWQSFEGVIQLDRNTLNPVPYILEGLEWNGDLGLQSEERALPPTPGIPGFLPDELSSKPLKHDADFQNPANQYTEANKDQNQIIAYYNFAGVTFHDGEPVDIMDVLFSYHLLALHPRWYTDISPLMDQGGITGNYSTDRWLWIWPIDDNDGNSNTAALRFHITTNYAQLFSSTMSVPIFPQHVWEGTGKVRQSDGSYKTNVHDGVDFGYAIDANGKGVSTTHPTLDEFDITNKAMGWEPEYDEIIGTGMFKFLEFVQGSHAKVVTNQDYLEMPAADIHVPYIDAIEFIKFSTPQQATMGIKKGEADIILWSVPPDFISDLQSDPNVAITSNPEPGFFYLTFNMRTEMFGYQGGDPANGDDGIELRKAIAQLIDKKTIVDYYLQGYGIIADGPVSPLNTFWYNSTLPGYDFDVNAAQARLTANGYIDQDGDGWRDMIPGGTDDDAQIELLAPTADYDPIRAQACILIETHLKAAGINVFCNHQAFGTIISKIDARTFQMYILGWSIGGTDPDYLYSFFYSLNSERGQNYPGYKSTAFDDVILASRTEMVQSKRQELIKEAQGILANDMPYNVLYYRKNIEAYRLDRFTGWVTTASGSLFNYWSLMNIKQPSDKFLRTTTTVASAVSSNKTETITVTVRDQDRNVVKDAMVNIEIFEGNLSYQGTFYGLELEKLSNANGQLIVKYKAPYTNNENGTKVEINVWATREGYDDSGIKSSFMTVFPPGVKFLSVTISLNFGDLIDESESTEIEIKVKDQDLNPVDGANLNLSSTPTDLTIEPSSGSTSNGGVMEDIVVTAPKVTTDTQYVIMASPSKGAMKGVNGTVELTILDIPAPPSTPGFDILTVIAVISMAAIVYGVIATRRKKM